MQNKLQKIWMLIVISFISIHTFSMTTTMDKPLPQKEKEALVLIQTPYGDIKVKLYNETPLHRDNFLKLVNEGFYDSLLFHRVIEKFMIQGGDPDSRNAKPGEVLGNGGPGYEIPAEFHPDLFHKRGVLAAAREPDMVNPEKKSSGSQFYIVQGDIFNDDALDMRINHANQSMINKVFQKFINKPENKEYRDRLDTLQRTQDMQAMLAFQKELEEVNKKELEKLPLKKLSAEQREAYTTIGGAPHLDGAYTVFGEVVSGMEVVDQIAAVERDKSDRPTENIWMVISVVEE